MVLEQLLDLAKQAGASQAEVYQSRSHSQPVFFEANRLKQLESSQSQGTALRVWREGCPGVAVAYGAVEPHVLVEKAIALSRLTPPETAELAEARREIHPDTGTAFAVDTLIEVGNNAIAQIREAYPEVVCSAEFECEQETTTLINSQGLYCQSSDTALSYFLGVERSRGEDFLGVYDGDSTRSSLDTASIIKQILQRLEWAQTNTASPTGQIPVLWSANAVPMLWETVSEAMNGKRVLEKSSPWNDKVGKQVVSPLLTFSQQPEQGCDRTPFDDEGTPTQVLSLITQGQLQQFYRDRTTARLLGVSSTGNGFRPGLGSYPTPELVNLLVEPGTGSLLELIAKLDDGLIIDQTLGGGADISGDFSVNIDLGYRVRNGEIVGRVKDTMVAGNVYHALKQVKALGGDARWHSSCYTPSVIVEGLSVIGGGN